MRFLNELLREEGVDYDLLQPKIVQNAPGLYAVQLDRNFDKLSRVIAVSEGLRNFVASDNFSQKEMLENFDNSVAAYTLFSFVFGGFYPDLGMPGLLDSIYVNKTGHMVVTSYNHILGFANYHQQSEKVRKDNLFLTREIGVLVQIDTGFQELFELIWKGYEVLQRNYLAVMQACRLLFADWDIQPWQLDALYERLTIVARDEEFDLNKEARERLEQQRLTQETGQKQDLKEKQEFTRGRNPGQRMQPKEKLNKLCRKASENSLRSSKKVYD